MPLPEPLPTAMMWMKPLLLTAVHVQLVPLAEMTMLLEPPDALKLALVVAGETMQAAAASVIENVEPGNDDRAVLL